MPRLRRDQNGAEGAYPADLVDLSVHRHQTAESLARHVDRYNAERRVSTDGGGYTVAWNVQLLSSMWCIMRLKRRSSSSRCEAEAGFSAAALVPLS